MKYRAEINIMPLKELLDPQGKAVQGGLSKMNFETIQEVRIGKHITIQLSCDSKEEANSQIELACKQVLSNPIMERYTFQIFEEK